MIISNKRKNQILVKKYFSHSLLLLFLVFFSVTFAEGENITVSSIGPGAGTAVTVGVFGPTDANIMYAAGDCQGVMRSLDGGQSWSAPNTGLINPADPFYEAYVVLELEVDPVNTSNIYAGTLRGIYKSTDQASTWSQLDITSAIGPTGLGTHTPIGAIEVDPADNNIIYAGFGDIYFHDTETAKGVLLKSPDGGANWSRIGSGTISATSIVYGLALDPDGTAGSRRTIVSTDKGIYLSVDAGATFSLFETGLPHNKGRRVVASRASGRPTMFYLGLFPSTTSAGDGGVYKWEVGTNSWTDANGTNGSSPLVLNDLTSCIYNWIDVDPNNPNTIFVASAPSYVEPAQCDTETFFRSTDGGANWKEMWPTMTNNEGWFEEYPFFPMFAVSPSSPATLLAGYLGMSKSTDSGDNWTQIYTKVQGTNPRTFKSLSTDIGSQMWTLSMAIDPRASKADTMYHGYADTLLFKTDDMTYFRRLWALPSTQVDPITDLAEGWGSEGDANLTPQVTLDPDDPDTVYASANYRFYKSADGGANWSELTGWTNPYTVLDDSKRENAARFAIDPSSPQSSRTIYVTVYLKGLYKSTDGGQSWTDLSRNIGTDATKVSGVYLDPSDSQRIYLGTFSLMHYSNQDHQATYPIYYSGDGGTSWEIRGTLPTVNRIWIDPQDGQRLLAAAADLNTTNNQGGVYLSTNGGQNWDRVLDQAFVTDIISDPHVTDRMWALSTAYYQPDTGLDIPGMNAGLYKSTDKGNTWEREDVEFNHYSLYPIVAHPTRAGELYIGTAGLGVKKVVLSDNPVPDIKANDSDETVTIGTSETLTITVSLDAGGSSGAKCDWWVAESTPDGWYYYSLSTSWTSAGSSYNNLLPTYQGALFDLGSYNVLNTSGLSVGTHTFYFAIDTNKDGNLDLDQIYYDSVVVNVTE